MVCLPNRNGLFLLLRVFGLLSLSLLLFPQRYGQYVLWLDPLPDAQLSYEDEDLGLNSVFTSKPAALPRVDSPVCPTICYIKWRNDHFLFTKIYIFTSLESSQSFCGVRETETKTDCHKVSKVGSCSRGLLESSLFNSYYTEV